MTDAPTLAAFLLARIAEDEVAARAAQTVHRRQVENLGGGKWGREYLKPIPAEDVRRDVVASIPPGMSSPGDSWTDKPGTALFDRFDPARVLAECEAKRRIVELHGGAYDGACLSPAHLDGPCPTLRALASIWADNPDYRDEWRP